MSPSSFTTVAFSSLLFMSRLLSFFCRFQHGKIYQMKIANTLLRGRVVTVDRILITMLFYYNKFLQRYIICLVIPLIFVSFEVNTRRLSKYRDNAREHLNDYGKINRKSKYLLFESDFDMFLMMLWRYLRVEIVKES